MDLWLVILIAVAIIAIVAGVAWLQNKRRSGSVIATDPNREGSGR